MRRGTRGPTRAGRGTCPRSRSTAARRPFGRRCADGRRRGAPASGRRAPRGGGGGGRGAGGGGGGGGRGGGRGGAPPGGTAPGAGSRSTIARASRNIACSGT